MTTVRSINKTDAMTLATTFGSVRGIMTANRAQLAQCPGKNIVYVFGFRVRDCTSLCMMVM